MLRARGGTTWVWPSGHLAIWQNLMDQWERPTRHKRMSTNNRKPQHPLLIKHSLLGNFPYFDDVSIEMPIERRFPFCHVWLPGGNIVAIAMYDNPIVLIASVLEYHLASLAVSPLDLSCVKGEWCLYCQYATWLSVISPVDCLLSSTIQDNPTGGLSILCNPIPNQMKCTSLLEPLVSHWIYSWIGRNKCHIACIISPFHDGKTTLNAHLSWENYGMIPIFTW